MLSLGVLVVLLSIATLCTQIVLNLLAWSSQFPGPELLVVVILVLFGLWCFGVDT